MLDKDHDPETKKILNYLRDRGYVPSAIKSNGRMVYVNPKNWAERINNLIQSQPKYRIPAVIATVFFLILLVKYVSVVIFLYQKSLLSKFSLAEQLGGTIEDIKSYYSNLILLFLSFYGAIKSTLVVTRLSGGKHNAVSISIGSLLIFIIIFTCKNIYTVASTDSLPYRIGVPLNKNLVKHREVMNDLEYDNVSQTEEINFVYFKPLFYTYNKFVVASSEKSKRYYILSRRTNNFLAVVDNNR